MSKDQMASKRTEYSYEEKRSGTKVRPVKCTQYTVLYDAFYNLVGAECRK